MSVYGTGASHQKKVTKQVSVMVPQGKTKVVKKATKKAAKKKG